MTTSRPRRSASMGFEGLTARLVETWGADEPTGRSSAFRCRCGRPVYFHNSLCLGCQAPLGYEPGLQQVRALVAGAHPETWTLDESPDPGSNWRRCDNFESPVGCNWLVPVEDEVLHCRACRLNQTIPSLEEPDHRLWWRRIERAKRRLVAQLLGMGLPVVSRVMEDPERGLMFDLLRSPAGGPRVLTGHANGLITLNVEEADDSTREKIRHELREPYRTLLGHFRHEVGHYYWDVLVAKTSWHEKFRELFGDERQDYAEALAQNYEHGPPKGWETQYISAYASVHPWEDWAETWAHYLHVVDSLDTAIRFGLRGADVEQAVEPFSIDDLYDPTAPDAERVALLVNCWVQLTTVVNELARSMGQHDFYPFVLSRAVLRKMHFIQMVVNDPSSRSALA